MFQKATRGKRPLRMTLDGPAGSGKTFTALRFAHALAGPGDKIAVIDTESHSSELYLGENVDGRTWEWDAVYLEHFAPSTYSAAIEHAGRSGYKVLVIDSLSHAWQGIGGALEQVDKVAGKSGNKFTAWADVTPQHRAMVNAILTSPCHVITTMRSHMEYAMEKDEHGKTTVRKVGMKPVQREGMEYEFDIVGDLDIENRLTISKTRYSLIAGKIVSKPGAEFMLPVIDWLQKGTPSSRYEVPTAAATPSSDSTATPSAEDPARNGHTQNGVTVDTAMRCDELLAGEIKRLAGSLGWPPDKLREVIARAGAFRLADLTVDQATALRHRLEAKLLESEGKAAF